MEFIWGWNIFQKFLNKPIQRERDFGGWKYFSKISYLPSPLESQLDSPINAVSAALSLINSLTRPQHTPARTKRHNALGMKIRPNQNVASGYAMATPVAHARVYLEGKVGSK